MWGSESSQQWENFFGIIVLQFVHCSPSVYGIRFYHVCAPPTFPLQFILCLRTWIIFFFFFFFLVSCSILLSMVVQQLVEILELLQKRWVHALLLHHLELRSDLWQYFYGFISWSNRNKNNSKQIRCNWTWKLFHSKGSHKQTTTTTKCPVEGQKKFANDETLNKLISRRYKYLMQVFHIYIYENTPSKKWSESLKRHFFKKTYRWPNAHEKNAQPLITERNSDQNYMKYHLIVIRMANIKSIQMINVA